jgi:hypothetical protein
LRAVVSLGHAWSATADKGELVVGWGGSLAKAQRKAFLDEFERQAGYSIKDGMLPDRSAKRETERFAAWIMSGR